MLFQERSHGVAGESCEQGTACLGERGKRWEAAQLGGGQYVGSARFWAQRQ